MGTCYSPQGACTPARLPQSSLWSFLCLEPFPQLCPAGLALCATSPFCGASLRTPAAWPPRSLGSFPPLGATGATWVPSLSHGLDTGGSELGALGGLAVIASVSWESPEPLTVQFLKGGCLVDLIWVLPSPGRVPGPWSPTLAAGGASAAAVAPSQLTRASLIRHCLHKQHWEVRSKGKRAAVTSLDMAVAARGGLWERVAPGSGATTTGTETDPDSGDTSLGVGSAHGRGRSPRRSEWEVVKLPSLLTGTSFVSGCASLLQFRLRCTRFVSGSLLPFHWSRNGRRTKCRDFDYSDRQLRRAGAWPVQ